MKKIALLSLMTFFISLMYFASTFNVYAASSSEIILTEKNYYESTYIDGDIVKNQIDSNEAEGKIKLKKEIKKLEKEISKLSKTEKKNKVDVDLNDDMMMLMSIGPSFEFEGGGGSGPITLIVEAEDSTTDVECTLSTYSFCKGMAETVGEITTLETSVELDPHSNKSAKIVNVLTWYDTPNASYTDFMSIGYFGDLVTPDDNTIKATTEVWYEYKNYSWLGLVTDEEGEGFLTETLEYEDNKDVIEIQENGIIWSIEDVYTYYTTGVVNWDDITPIYDENGDRYDIIDINEAKYTLEAELDLRMVMGSIESYRDVSPLKFSGDYIHIYPQVNLTTNLALSASLGSTPVTSLTISPTVSLGGDGTRLTNISFYFY